MMLRLLQLAVIHKPNPIVVVVINALETEFTLFNPTAADLGVNFRSVSQSGIRSSRRLLKARPCLGELSVVEVTDCRFVVSSLAFAELAGYACILRPLTGFGCLFGLAKRMAELVGVKETGFRPIAFLALLAAPGVATFPDFCPFADFFLLWAVFTTLAETSGRDVDFFFENALCGTDLTFFDNFTLFEVFVRLGAADLLEDTAFFFLAVTLPLRALLEGSANLDDGDRRLLKLLPGTAARSDPEGTSGAALKRSASRSNPASFLRQPPGCQFYSRFRQTRATRLPFPSSRLLLGPICFELGYPFDSGNRGRFTPTCSMRVRGGLCARSG